MKRTIWVAGALAVAVVAAVPLWLVLDGGDDERRAAAFSSGAQLSGTWALSVDGIPAGVRSVSGCGIGAEVVNEAMGADGVVRKHITTPPRYETCEIQVGLGMPKSFYTWIGDTFDLIYRRKNVSLHLLDPSTGVEKIRLDLTNVLIGGLAIPKLDASVTNPVWLTVKLVPESIRKLAGSGKALGVSSTSKAASLDPSTLQLDVKGIGAIAYPSATSASWGGFELELTEGTKTDADDDAKQPEGALLGDLVVNVKEGANATALDAYFDSFVLKGTIGDDLEKQVTLSLNSGALTFGFRGVGIFAADQAGGADGSRRYGFYVETATFTVQ